MKLWDWLLKPWNWLFGPYYPPEEEPDTPILGPNSTEPLSSFFPSAPDACDECGNPNLVAVFESGACQYSGWSTNEEARYWQCIKCLWSFGSPTEIMSDGTQHRCVVFSKEEVNTLTIGDVYYKLCGR